MRIVWDLLDPAKIESGQIQFKEELFPVSELINEALEGLEPVAQEKGIELSINGSGLRSSVVGDKDKLA